MSEEDDQVSLRLADIERSERDILAVCERVMPCYITYQHFYLFGIARRALANSRAFKHMIADRNSLVALSIARLQLDTVLRLYALFWVKEPEQFAKAVFEGAPINRLKAADNAQLTDKYLSDRIAKRNDWVPDVYKETSGYIHFSHRHIKAALHMDDPGTGEGRVAIGGCDYGKPLSYYGEVVRAFLHMNMMIPVATEDWFSRIASISPIGVVGSNPPIG
jgi:hypothetical protein